MGYIGHVIFVAVGGFSALFVSFQHVVASTPGAGDLQGSDSI